ncbi:MAG: long-chain fatty acid--CoA ligase [Betaproteobacteria bacterium]|nr:long-chain fatty acid--CoA ligase [Betaproteobacteria bacterium]
MLTGTFLQSCAEKYGDKTAVAAGGQSLNYDELNHLANRFASALRSLGIQPGQYVGIFLRNIIEYPIAYFGIAKAGAVSVHLPLRFAEGEFNHALNKIPLAALIIEASMTGQIAWARRFVEPARLICVGDPAPDGAARFAALLDAAESPIGVASIDENSAAAILFTSGTTGFPKGAIQPHRGRFVSAQIAQADFNITPDDVLAVASPLYHAAGLYTWFHTGLYAGATAVLLPAWDAEQFMERCGALRITGAFAVPTQLAMLLRHPRFDPARLRSLRLVVFGGAPADPALIAELERSLPAVRFVQNYGQTETGPILSQHPEDRPRAPASIGRPNALAAVALFVARGKPAGAGEAGELATRGAHLMLGYYGDAEASAEFFKYGDGWGATGDLATRDEEGFITLMGRTRDTIISGAVNIYPAELERVARSHPDVADCAAFGVKDALWGELPAIAVMKKDGSALSEEALRAHFEGGDIARFKRPRAIFMVDSLPYTPAGKLLRSELKNRFPALTHKPAT